jgi:transposase
MSATRAIHSTRCCSKVLYMAFELSWGTWKLAFTVGPGQPPRMRTVTARETRAVLHEIRRAKERFGLPEEAPVVSCYEAGRDGFWLHRFLEHKGVENIVVDSASIEVNRRKRRAKSDRLDAAKLVSMLMRWHRGEDDHVWSVVHVPTVAAEDGRQLHRELIELKAERTELVNRIKGLLAGLGLSIVVDARLPVQLEKLRQWDQAPVPPELKQRILRAFQRWQLVMDQMRALERQRAREIREDPSPQADDVRRLMSLRGIGPNGAWLLEREFFGWRDIRNRRQLASLAGLTPTPYDSGQSKREQGISKAGNRLVRWMMTQLAWCWLHYQPQSQLSRWYQRRFGRGNSRMRKIGIVAVARKLLIALWRYLKTGAIPAGARLAAKQPAGPAPAAAVPAATNTIKLKVTRRAR